MIIWWLNCTTQDLCNISILDTFIHASCKPSTLSKHGVCVVQKNKPQNKPVKKLNIHLITFAWYFRGAVASVWHLSLSGLFDYRVKLLQLTMPVWAAGVAQPVRCGRRCPRHLSGMPYDWLILDRWRERETERERVESFKYLRSGAPPTGLEAVSRRVQVELALSSMFHLKTRNFCIFRFSCLSPQDFHSTSSSKAECLSSRSS